MEDPSALEQQVTLAEILDPDSLQRVCMTFARLFGSGLAVVDSHGQVLVDIPAQFQICRRVGDHPAGSQICGSFDYLIQSAEADDAQGPITPHCKCGLNYKILAIRHQGKVLGRLVFGPYKPVGMSAPADEFVEALHSDDTERDARVLAAATADLEKLKALTEEEAAAAVRSIGNVLSVIVQTSYARHLTSQIHIAAIQEAYNELTEKNRRLADSVEKLKDLDKLKSNFLATVSHELRTPLTSVIGYSEMLIEGLAGALSSEQKDYVQIIMEKGDQLLQIITEVLDISKIETGSIQLSCEWIKLTDLLHQVADAMMPQARTKDIALTYAAPEILPSVWADRAKTRQAILNLVSNAIKFTPREGAVEICAVETKMRSEDESPVSAGRPAIKIQVRDSGIGVPQESRKKIFEAFYQVDSSSTREYGGTGLGLSIVKNFVEAHGGRVWVEPAESSGSIFNVELPVHPAKTSAASRVSMRSQSAG
jgi:two-component system sensor histidine kinase BarA